MQDIAICIIHACMIVFPFFIISLARAKSPRRQKAVLNEILAKGHTVNAVLKKKHGAVSDPYSRSASGRTSLGIYEYEFKALGCEVTVTTVEGSYGLKGFVTTALAEMEYTYFYTCGPEPMLKAIYKASVTSGQMSFEKRMGCGFGACMGCSCKTITGYKRICKEGPVMKKEEILWED